MICRVLSVFVMSAHQLIFIFDQPMPATIVAVPLPHWEPSWHEEKKAAEGTKDVTDQTLPGEGVLTP